MFDPAFVRMHTHSRSCMRAQTDRQLGGQAGRQAGRQGGREAGRQAGRHPSTLALAQTTYHYQGYAEQYFGGIPGIAEGGAVLPAAVKMLVQCSVASVLGVNDWHCAW